MISPLNDLTSFPTFPAPWSVVDNHIVDATGKIVSACGVNICGYANLPTTKSQSTTRAKKLLSMGIRVVRVHHIDVLLQENWDAHSLRLQWWLDSLKKVGIPVITEVWSQAEMTKWGECADRLLKLDLSNVVAICPRNEVPSSSIAGQIEYLRKGGYKGLIFGSNSMVQGGEPGELANAHIYHGGDNLKIGEFNRSTYDTRINGMHSPYLKPQSLPVIITETGQNWPSPNRRQSEQNIIDHCLSIGAQVICMFALATRPEHWSSTWMGVEFGDSLCFAGDPERMQTLEYLAHRMANVPYLPNSHTKGLKAPIQVDGDRWTIGMLGAPNAEPAI